MSAHHLRRLAAPLLLVLSMAALGGCAHATIRKAASLDAAPPKLLVVVPPDPGYAPPEAAPFVRNLLLAELARRGYQPMQPEQVDPVLRPGISAAELAQTLQADAVLYTRITQYALDRSIFNTRTTFGVHFTMYDPKGNELWVAMLDGGSDSSASNPVDAQGPITGVIHAAVDVANANAAAERPPFAEVATSVVRACINELPAGPLAR